jgi:hypothetical protein
MSRSLIQRCEALAERIVLPSFAVSLTDFLNAPVLKLSRALDEETRCSISLLAGLLYFVSRYERPGPNGAVTDPTLRAVYRLLECGGLLREDLPSEVLEFPTEMHLAVLKRIREIGRIGACEAPSMAQQVEWGQLEARMNEALSLTEPQFEMVVSIIKCVLDRCVTGGFGGFARPRGEAGAPNAHRGTPAVSRRDERSQTGLAPLASEQ